MSDYLSNMALRLFARGVLKPRRLARFEHQLPFAGEPLVPPNIPSDSANSSGTLTLPTHSGEAIWDLNSNGPKVDEPSALDPRLPASASMLAQQRQGTPVIGRLTPPKMGVEMSGAVPGPPMGATAAGDVLGPIVTAASNRIGAERLAVEPPLKLSAGSGDEITEDRKSTRPNNPLRSPLSAAMTGDRMDPEYPSEIAALENRLKLRTTASASEPNRNIDREDSTITSPVAPPIKIDTPIVGSQAFNPADQPPPPDISIFEPPASAPAARDKQSASTESNARISNTGLQVSGKKLLMGIAQFQDEPQLNAAEIIPTPRVHAASAARSPEAIPRSIAGEGAEESRLNRSHTDAISPDSNHRAAHSMEALADAHRVSRSEMPAVTVTIGRLEIRRPSSHTQPAQAAPRARSTSLGQYLRQRAEEVSGE